MNIRVRKAKLAGTVKAVSSKSYAHRLLIAAALADDKTCIKCEDASIDIMASVRCLEALGARVRREGEMFYVTPIRRDAVDSAGIGRIGGADVTKPVILDCAESGSTLRMLLPVVCSLGQSAQFHMKGRLPKRPLSPLDGVLQAHGCRITGQGSAVLRCEGALEKGVYSLPGNISSQFFSGLLLALANGLGESVVKAEGVLESKPYVDMTVDALSAYSVKVRCEQGSYAIEEGSAYRSPKQAAVEGDWSNAAFWLSAGALGKNSITCDGLNPESKQGDMKIVELLRRFGAQVECKNDAVSVSPRELIGIDIDAKDIPDLVPVLAAVASVAQGQTVISGAGRLRLKESDRLKSVTNMLRGLGADIKETEDGLIITGKKTLDGGTVSSFADHRIAMSAAVIATSCKDDVLILDADAVCKSYPGFFDDFSSLGGVIKEEE